MPPRKRVLTVVKIQLAAGSATPAPPVGTALGPHGVQTMEFCKQYNAATESQRGTIVPVEITIYEDRSFTFVLKTPPTPVLLRQAVGVEKGSANTGRDQVATVSDAQLADIAKIKLPDLNTDDLESAKRQVAGTARSMGIAGVADPDRHATQHTTQKQRRSEDTTWCSTARSTGSRRPKSTGKSSTGSLRPWSW